MRRLYDHRAVPCHDASVRPGPAPEQAPGTGGEPDAAARSRLAADASRTVMTGLQPETCQPPPRHAGPALAGDVDPVEALGAELMVHFTIDARRIRAEGD